MYTVGGAGSPGDKDLLRADFVWPSHRSTIACNYTVCLSNFGQLLVYFEDLQRILLYVFESTLGPCDPLQFCGRS